MTGGKAYGLTNTTTNHERQEPDTWGFSPLPCHAVALAYGVGACSEPSIHAHAHVSAFIGQCAWCSRTSAQHCEPPWQACSAVASVLSCISMYAYVAAHISTCIRSMGGSLPYSLAMTCLHACRLQKLGVTPYVRETLPQRKYAYVAFAAPPSGSQDYVADVRRAAHRHALHTGLLSLTTCLTTGLILSNESWGS